MKDTDRKQIPPELLPRLRDIITKADWIFAFTYAKSAPHEYCLAEDKKRGNVPKTDMLLLAKAIWDYGYKEPYKTYLQTYVDIDEHKYWSMDPSPESTDLINRAPLTEEGIQELLSKNGF